MDSTSSSRPGETILLSFSPADAHILKEFAKPIWEKAYTPIISTTQIQYMLERGYSPGTIQREISDGVRYQWVIQDDRKAGFLACETSPDRTAFLHKFYLLPSFWGQGIARSAMGTLSGMLSKEGVQTLRLRVNRENRRAHQFYENCGFVKTGEDCLPIGNGFVMDDFLMSLSLH